MLRWVVAECRHSTLEPGYSGVGVVCFVGTGKEKKKKKSGRKDTPPRGGESWEAQEMRPKKRTNFECLAPGYSWD